MPSQLGSLLLRVVGVAAAAYAALLGYLYVAQESIIFVGRPLPAAHAFDFDVPFEEVDVEVDGAVLNALHFRQPDPRGVVFFLHGNGGNLESWTSGVKFYQRVNYDLFMFDYRGYGKSTGAIESEAQLHEDVRTLWNRIAPLYADKRKVIYGRSLGAALAARLATDAEADLVALVSPFESMLTMADAQYPIVPARLVRYPFRNDLAVPAIEAPILFVHGDRDELIPLEHSHRLLERAITPSRLLVIEGADHNDIHQFDSYLSGFAEALP